MVTWMKFHRDGTHESGGTTGPEYKRYLRSLLTWWHKWLQKHPRVAQVTVTRGHYCAKVYFLVGDQWYYMIFGDIRVPVAPECQLRKVSGPDDFGGKTVANILISDGKFEPRLNYYVFGTPNPEKEKWHGVDIVRPSW